ncbi:unnamed protein product [Fusarium fujikuroi]|uniref:Uncharacterized protein n=1 Tax=Fusarium fujikuroi TaxID=5127 RepID=A0A9Q9RWT7_FUSFU|nr:uncharacterized protein FFE2_15841 [Fusarium fujikuroi]VTT79700.1 unnamed protein product [Fusarium fujikuroi]VZH99355.1 unnamed protein product [Fusarium fujikuroi]
MLNSDMTGNTSRTLSDAKHYLKVNDKRTTIARQGTYLLFISTDKSKLGPSKPKPDQNIERIIGSKSYCVTTLAIWILNEATIQERRVTTSGNTHHFSYQLRDVIHLKRVSYRSPPQASSSGFEISEDILNQAENLSAPKIAYSASTAPRVGSTSEPCTPSQWCRLALI